MSSYPVLGTQVLRNKLCKMVISQRFKFKADTEFRQRMIWHLLTITFTFSVAVVVGTNSHLKLPKSKRSK